MSLVERVHSRQAEGNETLSDARMYEVPIAKVNKGERPAENYNHLLLVPALPTHVQCLSAFGMAHARFVQPMRPWRRRVV
jgi:hypothetical protein